MNLLVSGQLWRITAPHFVAGITVAQDGVIVDTAPILKWARGNSSYWFAEYCTRKGWKVERL